MTRFYGRTYCVTPWGYEDTTRQIIFTQHGEKWSPTGVFKTWERYGQYLNAIWLRWYDSGGDHDVIRVHNADGHTADEPCRYCFDRVCIRGSPIVNNMSFELSGTYLAENARSSPTPFEHVERLPTPTTPVEGRMRDRKTLRWAEDGYPVELVRLEASVMAEARSVEFLWRGRRTRVYERRNDRWWSWSLDDWDNCVETGWMAARHFGRIPAFNTPPSCDNPLLS